jgi:hypothetical protein
MPACTSKFGANLLEANGVYISQLSLSAYGAMIKTSASFKRFYASGIVLIIALSGLYFAFKEVKTAVSFFSGSKLMEGKKGSLAQWNIAEGLNYGALYQALALRSGA